MSKFLELESNVIRWAQERGIFDRGDALAQLDKTEEELDETINAVKALENWEWAIQADPKNVNPETIKSLKNEVADGIGDMLVTIIIAAEMLNLQTLDCLQLAYDEIKDRTGKMVDGQFVKDK
jgi:NTP pyrophosphatase (non-canonical NTP hydrolase)